MSRSALALLVLLALGPAAEAQLHLPLASEVLKAVRRGDDNDIERLAQRLLAMRLWRIVERGQPDERRAALVAIGYADDGWAVAPSLLALAASGPASEAEAAARTLFRLAERWSPLYLETNDVPSDLLSGLVPALRRALQTPTLGAAIRVPLVGTAGRLIELSLLQESELRPLFHDGDAEVRLAAVEALRRLPKRSVEGLDLVITGDTDAKVAAAAAAALCFDVPPVQTTALAETRARRLSAPGQARLRALAVDDKLPLLDRLDLVACLRVFGTPDDEKILATLASHGPESMKRRARSLQPK